MNRRAAKPCFRLFVSCGGKKTEFQSVAIAFICYCYTLFMDLCMQMKKHITAFIYLQFLIIGNQLFNKEYNSLGILEDVHDERLQDREEFLVNL